MELVIIESPFKGNEQHTEEEHKAYLNECIFDCLWRGESPYASHKMLTESLDDSVESEREAGILAGLEWKRLGIRTIFYVDYGMSGGMKLALDLCKNDGIEYELRTIKGK